MFLLVHASLLLSWVDLLIFNLLICFRVKNQKSFKIYILNLPFTPISEENVFGLNSIIASNFKWLNLEAHAHQLHYAISHI
jgi:hypothetical protein